MGFDLLKMFTPPKSKDPWTAMTKGSTGGWAKPFAKPAALLPFAASVLAAPFTGGQSLWALPAIGATVGGIQGATTGIWGQKGTGSSILSGAGWGGAQGLGAYMGAAGGFQNVANAIQGWGTGAGTSALGTAGTSGLTSGAGAGGKIGVDLGVNAAKNLPAFNLQNIGKYILGGAPALLGLMGGSGVPQLTGNKEEALSAVYSPNLTEARGLIKNLALQNPSELISPASDEFVNATLRQSREAADRIRRETLNRYSAMGKVPGKSGSVDEYMRQADKAQIQQESDFIAGINESRKMAAVNLKIQLVMQYYNVAAEEAANVLAAYGYVNNIDAQNYLAALQEYNTSQILTGYSNMYSAAKGVLV